MLGRFEGSDLSGFVWMLTLYVLLYFFFSIYANLPLQPWSNTFKPTMLYYKCSP